MKFGFWKSLMTACLATFATSALVACGGDSSSSAESGISSDSGPSEEEIARRCYEKFGTTENDTWAETLSGNEFISKQVCESISEYMSYQLAFYARCTSADYNSAKNRFDIEVITEQRYMHIWAEMDGCSYKLGTDGDMEPLIAKGRQWTLDDCLCKENAEKTLYREIKPEEKVESSSSSENVESSSSKDVSSSSVLNGSAGVDGSSSSIEKVSSSSQPAVGEFVKIGNQEWMTRNLDVDVEGSSCYNDKPENCEKYGRIYTWSMAMDIDISYDRKKYGETKEPHQGICPEGSHLPSHEEWMQLNEFIKANPEYLTYFQNQYGGAYDYKGFYRSVGSEVTFISSTEYDVSGSSSLYEYAWLWYIHDNHIYFYKDNGHKYTGAYVRCVKGELSPNTVPSSSSGNATPVLEVAEGCNDYGYNSNWEYLNPDVEYGCIFDERDSHYYKTVYVGDQLWMAENLRYEATVGSSWCFNDELDEFGDCNEYGRYYGGNAIATDDPICPEGYRVPSQSDVNKLIEYMKNQEAGVEIFMAKTDLWDLPNENAFEGNNATGLTMLPGGLRGYDNGRFYETGVYADYTHRFHMWLSDRYNGLVGNYTFLFSNITQWGGSYSITDKERGFGIPVRCIKE
ncbi:MAG: FISUMP domain-containing protein [Fibrobacter sp.]|nr:FISUMP domain-containing protein [Fibrobacter sp.]